jgi:predicted RNA-binding protein with PUA domain
VPPLFDLNSSKLRVEPAKKGAQNKKQAMKTPNRANGKSITERRGTQKYQFATGTTNKQTTIRRRQQHIVATVETHRRLVGEATIVADESQQRREMAQLRQVLECVVVSGFEMLFALFVVPVSVD